MAMDDYYELLDVAPDSERDDIRVAYRAKREALQATDGDQTRAEVAHLNRAWNVLSDPTQRERYDERLAEARESDNNNDDYDDDEPAATQRPTRAARPSRSAPLTKAEERAEARRARTARQATIVVPAGLTMASIRDRLRAFAFDLLVLLVVLFVAYFAGFRLIDNHFPGERSRGSALLTQQDTANKNLTADQKRVATDVKAAAAAKLRNDTAGEQKANAAAATARRAATKDTNQKNQLGTQINKINKQLSPWIVLIFVSAFAVMILYLVPSTAISGQTLGKRISKIRVVHVDGSPVGWTTAVVRFGVPLLVGLFLAVPLKFQLLGFAIPVFGMLGWISKPNRQGLHDKLAKTIVVGA
jgi:curved DNA-binding protein CbpA